MNTNDFFELKKSYDTSQMPEKEVIKMKEKMNQAKAEKKNKHNKTIITRLPVQQRQKQRRCQCSKTGTGNCRFH